MGLRFLLLGETDPVDFLLSLTVGRLRGETDDDLVDEDEEEEELERERALLVVLLEDELPLAELLLLDPDDELERLRDELPLLLPVELDETLRFFLSLVLPRSFFTDVSSSFRVAFRL